MKKVWRISICILVSVTFILSCSNTPVEPYTPRTITISMVDNEFQPPQITINKSDTVKWVNNGYTDHTSTSGKDGVPNGIWNSGIIHYGSNYSRVFDGTGTYQYFCSVNWQDGMVGVVTVVEP